MKNYRVSWCDIHDTCGGILEVEAKNKADAEVKAIRILHMGCDLLIHSIWESD